MNAPVIWIVIPGLLAFTLFWLRYWYRISVLVGALAAGFLALLAGILPVGQAIHLYPLSFEISETLSVLGRRFVLSNADRPLLALIYLLAAYWFGAAYIARAGRLYVPMGMAVVALLTAALAVDPFLYSALFIEVAVLVSIPMLVLPGKTVSRGVLRFLVFETIGTTFILFTGWMLSGIETNPADADIILRSTSLLGFAFMILLAVFPFHTWILILAEETHAYAVIFILVMLPLMISMLGLDFLNRYAWLRETGQAYLLLRWAGVLMVSVSGIWAAFEKHLGRVLGYAVMMEIGYTLLTMGLRGGYPWYFEMLLPRVIALGTCALGLTYLQSHFPDLRIETLRGAGRSMPFASAAVILSLFSIAGLPLLAGFPLRLMVWENLAAQSLWGVFLAGVGSVGMAVVGLRALAVLVMGADEEPWRITEPWPFLFYLGTGMLVIVLIGILPQWLLTPLTAALRAFPSLSP